jgi:hypothetical protein
MLNMRFLTALALTSAASLALAQQPPPSDEAKAKAAAAAAKAAHGGKVAAYQLCKSMDQVAASYYANAKREGRDTKPPVPTAACVDPGPFAAAPAAAK